MIPLPIRYAEVEAISSATFGTGQRSVALLTPKPRGGSSTLAYALARRVAESGKRTLLVELNLAQPALGARLALPRFDWTADDETIAEKAVALGTSGVHLLTAPLSAEHVSFREPGLIKAFITALEQAFDAVIIDCSPLLSKNRGNVPPALVARACSSAVLVVPSGGVSEGEMLEAAGICADAGVAITGAVFNDRKDPRLVDELCRECDRLNRFLPGLARKLQRWIRGSTFLGQGL
ncbi:MAG: hypothetical protein ACPGOV_14370 [Magnetovibrionaceae bacterium]